MLTMKTFRAAAISAALAVPLVAPASAQVVIAPGGLVNVQVVDVLDTGDINVIRDVDVALGVAVQIAANVSDVSVNVLAEQLKGGDASCSAPIQGGVREVSISN